MSALPSILAVTFVLACATAGADDERPAAPPRDPFSPAERTALRDRFERDAAQLTRQITAQPLEVELYSRRGDAHFFRGDFAAAVADYEKMVDLDPRTANSHWRRGIAWFYQGNYKSAAHQFEIYHTFDDVDRENGIWRYLSQVKSLGVEPARAAMLKYKKDDREPFRDVYRLFAAETTSEQILSRIAATDASREEKNRRLFYAHLYVGLNDVIMNRPADARKNLRLAVTNPWAEPAGYGPAFMWHVARLQYELLDAPPKLRPDAEPK